LLKFLETGAAENNNDDPFIKQMQGAFREIKTGKKWGVDDMIKRDNELLPPVSTRKGDSRVTRQRSLHNRGHFITVLTSAMWRVSC